MLISKYGLDIILLLFLIIIILMTLSLSTSNYFYIPTTCILILLIFVIFFFRDPNRMIKQQDKVLSPADGRVIHIIDKDEYTIISIRLTIFDCHINRIPVSGVITSKIHTPGNHSAIIGASNAGSANESTSVEIITKEGDKVIVKQIAGMFARRIVCNLQVGQKVKAGDKFGMIKFGSLVKLYIPIKYKLKIHLYQYLYAGTSIIAHIS